MTSIKYLFIVFIIYLIYFCVRVSQLRRKWKNSLSVLCRAAQQQSAALDCSFFHQNLIWKMQIKQQDYSLSLTCNAALPYELIIGGDTPSYYFLLVDVFIKVGLNVLCTSPFSWSWSVYRLVFTMGVFLFGNKFSHSFC